MKFIGGAWRGPRNSYLDFGGDLIYDPDPAFLSLDRDQIREFFKRIL